MARKGRRNKQSKLRPIRAAKQRVMNVIRGLESSVKAGTERAENAKREAARLLRNAIGAESKRTKRIRREHGVAVKQSKKSLSAGVKAAKSIAQGSKGNAQRANLVMQQQMSLAQRGQPSTLGEYGRAKVKIFYRATQRYWEGKGPNRNENILKALNVKTLDEAMSIVLAGNSEALQAAMDADKSIIDTNASEFAYSGQQDIETSPDYLALVNYV